MTIRRSNPLPGVRRGVGLLATGTLGVLTLMLSLGAARAEAVLVRSGPSSHGFGVTLRHGVDATSIAGAYRPTAERGANGTRGSERSAQVSGGNLKYFGGPVMHSATTHVVYWDPNNEFTSSTKTVVSSFFGAVAHDDGLASNVFAVGGQYTDTSGNAAYSSTYAGSYHDTKPYPSSGCSTPTGGDSGPPYTHCLTDAQLQSALTEYIAQENLPKGSTQLYFLYLPHKVVTCYAAGECSSNVFCAYHSYIEPDTASEIIYAVIPFSLLDTESAKDCQYDGNSRIQTPNGDTAGTDLSTRFADVALGYTSHEYIEAVTDPLVGTNTAWVDESGYEIGDKCAATGTGADDLSPNAFLPTLGGESSNGDLYDQVIQNSRFYLQSEWDNAGQTCLTEPQSLQSVNIAYSSKSSERGWLVSFTGTVADPYGKPSFSWDFGDGQSGSGERPAHTYAHSGEYTVTLTVTDALTGSRATLARKINVQSASESESQGTSTSSTSFQSTTTQMTSPPAVAATPTRSFTAHIATVNVRNGAITLSVSIQSPGTISWMLTFENEKFGVFASRAGKCRAGLRRLTGKCRPSRIVFGAGARAVVGPATITFTVTPGSSALKALNNALRKRTGLPVKVILTYQPAHGERVASSQVVTVRLRKR